MLVMESSTHLSLLFEDYKKFALKPKKEFFDAMLNEKRWELMYFSKTLQYSIDNESISSLLQQYITFYPIYENYIKLSSGNSFDFEPQLDLLRKFLIQIEEAEFEETDEEILQTEKFTSQQLLEIAEKKI